MSATTTMTVMWTGRSGNAYEYYVYTIPPNFRPVPGNYIYAREISPGRWLPIYIGETSDLSERFEAHHKADCIRRNRATHIHAHLNHSYLSRLAEERDLVAMYRPPCNG